MLSNMRSIVVAGLEVARGGIIKGYSGTTVYNCQILEL